MMKKNKQSLEDKSLKMKTIYNILLNSNLLNY